jgi:predicted ATPase/class 3 adenylate cyclase
MAALPTGTVTFLFTDVEGSTRLWEEAPEAMRAALVQHDAIVEFLTEQHGGQVVRPRGEGDSRFCVFARATDAVAAAAAIQRALHEEAWPTPTGIRVRMALHTGEADLRDGDYYGGAVNRCARLRGIGHGGQILLSNVTADLAGAALPPGTALRDLGEHRLRDLTLAEHVFELAHPALACDFPPLRSLDAYRHNLPRYLTPFVGREVEVAEACRLLGSARLLTATGAGGCGKSRLAVHVAAELLDEYPDGVRLVDFAPIAEPTLVPRAIAAALGVRETAEQPTTATLAAALGPKRLLLVFDNCEHLIEPCARVADALLRSCAGLRVLATSRERLGVAGEVTWRVPSLAVPGSAEDRFEDVARSEAVRLFVERARDVVPSFRLTESNAGAVARICRRLDGIPLALELAAARVRVLSVVEIAARLDDGFRLLTGGRAAPQRHQTLRALVDWSHDLLSEVERVLFRRLAVFAGGWTLAAAEAVCTGGAPDVDVFDVLVGLIDKSLVVTDEHSGTTRYRLLETLRHYAWEKLVTSGEADALRRRHAAYHAQFVASEAPRLLGQQQLDARGRLERELDNLRAAMNWAVASGSPDAGLRIAGGLWAFWLIWDRCVEAREWLAQLLAAGDAPDEARAAGLMAAGLCGWAVGAPEEAEAHLAASAALRRTLGDRPGLAHCLNFQALAIGTQGRLDEAEALGAEALALFRANGDQVGVAWATVHLGHVAFRRGDLTTARSRYEETLALARDAGERWQTGHALHVLGYVALFQNDLALARSRYEEGGRVYGELADRHGEALSRYYQAGIAHRTGDLRRARDLYEGAVAVVRDLGHRRRLAEMLADLALVRLDQGDRGAARELLREAVALARESGHQQGLIRAVDGLAALAGADGRFDVGLRLAGAVGAARERTGLLSPQRMRTGVDAPTAWRSTAREALGEGTFRAAQEGGRRTSIDDAAALGLAEPPPSAPAQPVPRAGR